MIIRKSHFILYVHDQNKSTIFYSNVLGLVPTLNVPGMTEFELGPNCILGLMPEAGIKRLLGEKLPDPATAEGVPRAEVYLLVDGPQAFQDRALKNGAIELSPLLKRDWGHRASYFLDPDGHVVAVAEEVI